VQLSDVPLVAAPMAGGPTTPDLVLAAADAGVFGFLAAGYLTTDALADDIAAVRGRVDSFGVNLFVPDRSRIDRPAVLAYRATLEDDAARAGVRLGDPVWDDDDQWSAKVDLLLGEPVPWVSFTFGLPGGALVEALHDAGTEVAVTVTDAAEAAAAEEQGADLLVVQSSQAGGHRGSFDQRAEPDRRPLPDLLRAVRARTTLPLLGAGGVGTAHDVRTALSAGALAVQVGTALLLADEAGTRPTHRAALQDPAYDETAVTRVFTGRLARGLRNRFIDDHDADAPAGYPAIHHVTAPLRRHAAAAGDPDLLHLWAGTGHRHATSGPVADLLEALEP
jgi:NAD(P)H-dependent flavin oxidoreductase YrpB (nitropropane dioxygenase family)